MRGDPGSRERHGEPHRVVVLAIDEVVGYDLSIPPQIFGAAKRGERDLYDVRVCGVDRRPVRVESGYTAVLDHGPEALEDAQTVIVPGTRARGPRVDGVLTPEIAEALARIPPGARIMSICTGAFVLAAAGLLDGRRAATHWAHVDAFRRLHPRVELDEDVLFVDDGDVLTSAGLGAGVDLCLHVVRSDHGTAVSNLAARSCVVPPWREGGQSQFIERPLPETGEGSTAATQEWASRRLADPLDVAALAEHASMSVRTFSRRFRAETGLPPGAWLIQQRVSHARQLLETTSLPVDRVAAEAGLGSAASLRAHLNAAIGVSPLAYRRTFTPPAGTTR
ncbi:AraC family transcriptional regulator [Actinoalloteichus sp. AHMU CJ021]|uniref:Transcriptional regulator GlxA family, contains an amidase domain and an AraC-type DNA-binding HTH domain n=1 Tax=Actinoalloteichus caeruleus DSM 43889 TaxID=1120930 RepID=A0ABT1JEP2_ACTCY|nr:helix-turn-helix domain-containing protein [Actinoalloteichus caeruleus]AUS80822.1 AraC family transcriptional regulator [Actinoalloteichus sp. AHMU CJ021]MCP2330236.1 Transcriptional regulator GlxA family, contains an amidase domain and an AraC-type DNA-binding HTH domain [Actinoalloteichus caeruleus DSM 43889]